MTNLQSLQEFSTTIEDLNRKKQDKSHKQFKQVIADLVYLFRSSIGAETVSLHWVNKTRQQFVLETSSTDHHMVAFQDRVPFENHFLYPFQDLTEMLFLEIGKDIDSSELTHYLKEIPGSFLLVIPFINNGVTVALTVIELSDKFLSEQQEESVQSFIKALGNLLLTFLELSDLNEDETQWNIYDQLTDAVVNHTNALRILFTALESMHLLLPRGHCSLVVRCMNEWVSIAHSSGGQRSLMVGMAIDETSLAHQALQQGKPAVGIHINGSPKGLSSSEPPAKGASMALPVLVNDRRQAVFLVNDSNALSFNEATKHKLWNLVKLVSVKLEGARFSLQAVNQDIFSTLPPLLDMEVWRVILQREIKRKKDFPRIHSWFGLVTFEDLQTLRSKHRLDELEHMQHDTIQRISPTEINLNGVIGQFSDYIYAVFLQSNDENTLDRWVSQIVKRMEKPITFGAHSSKKVSLTIGVTKLTDRTSNDEQLVSEAKTALSHAVKNPDLNIFEY